MKNFQSGHNGFWLTFDNGVVLSTQFGCGNYCENRNERDFDKKYTSSDAEVAIMDENNNWLTKEYENNEDNVLANVSFDKWLEIVQWCKNYKKHKEIG